MSSRELQNGVRIIAAFEVISSLARALAEISDIIREAREDGRERFTAAEWQDILDTNDEARAELVDAIRHAETAEDDDGPVRPRDALE